MNKWLHKFMEKPDISDRFELLDKKMENMHGVGPDKPDRLDPNLNMSGLSGRAPGLLEKNYCPYPYDIRDFEERLAIAEYDGHQNATQAERIAYVDAFMAVLATLPYEGLEGDWLAQRVREAKEWLLDQGIKLPK